MGICVLWLLSVPCGSFGSGRLIPAFAISEIPPFCRIYFSISKKTIFIRKEIEKLFAVARERGFEQIELEVVADNENAIHLYKSMGFENYGTFPNNMKYKDGTYADAYWMMKNL